MEERTLTPETSYYCPGGLYYGNREYHCWRKQGHGTLSVHRAIVGSCDVFFYQVGIHLGIDRLAHWARLLGLGEKTGIDLENERAGVMPSSLWKEKRFRQRWYPAETLVGRDRAGLRRGDSAADGDGGGRDRQRRHPLQAAIR